MTFDILEYLKAKGNPTMTLLEFLKTVKELVLEMVKGTLDEKVPVAIEEARQKVVADFAGEAEKFIKENFSKLKGEDGHTPTNEEIVELIKPLIPLVKNGDTPTQEMLLGLIKPLIPKVQNGKTPTKEELIALITPLLRTPIAGVDYDIPKIDEESIVKKLLPKIKIPPAKAIPLTGAEVIRLINALALTADLQIDFSHIKNAPRQSSTKKGGSTILRGGQGSWKQKQLSGTIDGVNRAFTFSGDEPAEFSERVFLNYLEQNPFTDYAINYSTRTVTYTVAPDISLLGLPHIIRYM